MISVVMYFIMAILLLALLLVVVRLVKGPSTPDRIVSLDMIGSILMGFIICLGIIKDNSVYIDVVLIISLILFVGTVAMSKYLTENDSENGNSNNDNTRLG
ncbi:cation:proton antiporter [Carboxylicivirga sp. A043]|uniref:monovalent cation/H+ antiporter complex subunit F n=1 Tax=Carboxylicivirga litoralis TaxID=2816963 RepID=UPI0021CAF2FC|nr:monovalent cation/H+ antiporter complex subunit F [Carboxylicivirga sp. A043]MCU4154411.1 cation:proton antiporter [Carboxylicivirga sp. A043]